MCLGCIVSFCVFSVTYGGGQLVAWRAARRRAFAMARVENGVGPR